MRALWIEDQFETIEGTLLSAIHRGVDIELARSKSDAFDKLRKSAFDKVIIDYQIPASTGETAEKGVGLDIYSSIRNGEFGETTRSVPCLMLTAQSASIRNFMEILANSDLTLIEKPGSHKKVLNWLLK